MTDTRARVAERIICAGRPHDHEGHATGVPHGRRIHQGCYRCDTQVCPYAWGDLPCPLSECTVTAHLEEHAQNLARMARASSWVLGPEAPDGSFPHTMCPSCRRPEAGMRALLKEILTPAPDMEEGPLAGERETPLWCWA